jgi:TolB protein
VNRAPPPTLRSLLAALLLLAPLLLPAEGRAQGAPGGGKPVIDISGARFRPVPLAAPAPQVKGPEAQGALADFDAALQLDLHVLGIFEVLDRKGFLADAREGLTASSIQFRRWTDVGADALLRTQLSREGETLTAEVRLFNVAAGKEELALSEKAPASQPRRLAHRVADALFQHYTREPGVLATSRIAFGRKLGNGREVFVADWDGGNAQAVTRGGGLNLLPALVPGSDAVAFTSYAGGQPDLYVQSPGGRARPLVRRGAMATGVAFSPDGQRIAYSLSEGEGAQLWVADADGSNARKVTDTPSMINSSPAWSPDGKRLAFVSNRFGSPQVFVMNADGTGVQRLTYQGNYNQTPDWSPRGDLIAFTARDERNAFDLFVVEVASRKVTRLTQDQGNNEEPAFSPNGRHIVFTSTRDGSKRLWVMTADGSNQTALPLEKGTYLTPTWGAAGGR